MVKMEASMIIGWSLHKFDTKRLNYNYLLILDSEYKKDRFNLYLQTSAFCVLVGSHLLVGYDCLATERVLCQGHYTYR